MYSGSTLTAFSGRVLGAHQRVDRLAHKHLTGLLPGARFPAVRSILHFEGRCGPDAIKRKSPAKDEPWHFLEPFNPADTELITLIEAHYRRLVAALKADDYVRASFEAAWLSHAVVDGLTPAHHYPYEQKLVELAEGQTLAARTSVFKKVILPGATIRGRIRNNWRMWGPRGLFISHTAFEWGVAVLMMPLRLRRAKPTADKIAAFKDQPVGVWFRQLAQDVARLELYDAFCDSGWTLPLARQVRGQLAPVLVQAVAVIWYGAALEAGHI